MLIWSGNLFYWNKVKKEILILLLVIITSNSLKAQSTRNKYPILSFGYAATEGMYGPGDQTGEIVMGDGFYIQAEYVLGVKRWFEIRPYLGYMNVKTDKEEDLYKEYGYKANATSFLMGGKGRLIAPIPWIKPYLEIGIGASVGTFETKTESWDIKKRGVFYHIPLAIGVKVGSEHKFDIGFLYYIQPGTEQISGVMELGWQLPLL